MLSAGEYVIRKSAVKKYGPEYLQMLNEGRVEKRSLGGALMEMGATTQRSIGSAIAHGIAAGTGAQPREEAFASFQQSKRDIAASSKFRMTQNTFGDDVFNQIADNSMFKKRTLASSSAISTIYRKDEDKEIQKMFAGGSVLSKPSFSYNITSLTKTGGLSQVQSPNQIQVGSVSPVLGSNNNLNKNYLDSNNLGSSTISTSINDSVNQNLGGNYSDYEFRKGGRVQRFATGGEIAANAAAQGYGSNTSLS